MKNPLRRKALPSDPAPPRNVRLVADDGTTTPIEFRYVAIKDDPEKEGWVVQIDVKAAEATASGGIVTD